MAPRAQEVVLGGQRALRIARGRGRRTHCCGPATPSSAGRCRRARLPLLPPPPPQLASSAAQPARAVRRRMARDRGCANRGENNGQAPAAMSPAGSSTTRPRDRRRNSTNPRFAPSSRRGVARRQPRPVIARLWSRSLRAPHQHRLVAVPLGNMLLRFVDLRQVERAM